MSGNFNEQDFNGPDPTQDRPVYPVTITAPIPPPPQIFSNLATIISNMDASRTWGLEEQTWGDDADTWIGKSGIQVTLFRNGIYQTLYKDYFRSGSLLTFYDGSQPLAGDILTADVFTLQVTIDGAAPQYGTDQIKRRAAAPIQFSSFNKTILGVMDGVNLIFGLAMGPTIFGVLDGVNATFTTGVYIKRARVYRNGLLMTLGYDCAFYGTTVTFFKGQIPLPGDLIMIVGWI